MDVQELLQPLFEKLDSWLEGGVAIVPNLIVALVALGFFFILGRLGRRVTRRLGRQLNASVAIVGLLSSIVQYAIFVAGLVVALGLLGLQKAVVSILAGAGVAGLAIGFAFQDLAANFIAGVAMGIRQPFKVGDLIETADFLGHVETINLRNTIVRTFRGQRVIIPNRLVFENPLTNYDTYAQRRVDVPVGVAYDTRLDEAARIAKEAVEELDIRADDSEVDVVAEGFGASSIDLLVRFWIDSPGQDFYAARHAGVLAVKRAYDENGITIPFPIRTLDLPGPVVRSLPGSSADTDQAVADEAAA